MFKKIKEAMVNENELDSSTLRMLSLIFLLISGAMSFFKYTHIGWIWDTDLTFKPGFISSILAICLLSPLYMRGVLKWNKSIYTLISLVLIMMVFSSFLELAMGGNEKNTIVISLVVVSIVLSWLGIKAVAGVSWILVLMAAIYSVLVNDLALGFNGFLYVSSGFIGLILHSGLNPGDILNEIKVEFSASATKAIGTVKQDVSATV